MMSGSKSDVKRLDEEHHRGSNSAEMLRNVVRHSYGKSIEKLRLHRTGS